jgi:hypothetical protein
LAHQAKTRLAPTRFVGTVTDVTDRETTGTVTCSSPTSANDITVHVRANVDLAADDVIWIRQDPGATGVWTFDGFAKGGGTGNNAADAPIPWTQSPGVTSPAGSSLTVRAPSGQTTVIGRAGDATQLPGTVDLALDDLSDVNAGAPSDAQVLTWVDGSGEWQAQDATTGGAWPGAGVCMIDQTEYATLALAIAAASSGDQIKVGPGTLACDLLTLPDGVDLLGSGLGVTILLTSTQSIALTVGDGCYVENLTVKNTYNASQTYSIYMIDTDTAEFRNVRGETLNSGDFNAIGFYVQDDTKLIDCEGVGVNSGATGNGWGLIGASPGIYVYGGFYDGRGADAGDDISAGVTDTDTVNLVNPVCANSSINTILATGLCFGCYSDVNGNLIIVERVTEAVWPDFALIDKANACGVASHFRDNDASYPAGWTETDAALATNTNSIYSFWFLSGSAAETSWKYRIQTSITLESLAANAWASFQFGPLLFRDGDFTADVDYYFGLYRDSSGIDETTFSRVHLWWDSSSSLWKIRGEEKDGSTEHDGSWITLDQNPLTQPLWIRFLVRNDAGTKTTRQYFGTQPYGEYHQLLLDQAPSSAPTWGQVWLQIHQSRAGGLLDYLSIGAIDYLLGVA